MTESSLDADPPQSDSIFLRLLRRLIEVSPAELPALGWCWLYIFSVLASYYILRPIRDQMGVAGGVNNLPWLFTGTLIVMLILNVPFSAIVKLLPRKQFISLSYRFFALSILAFGAALHFATAEQAIWVGRFFSFGSRCSIYSLCLFFGRSSSISSVRNRVSGYLVLSRQVPHWVLSSVQALPPLWPKRCNRRSC
jgi:AAA family ATP:ADP antiporter